MTTIQKYGVNVIVGPTKGQPPLSVSSEIPAIWGAFPVDKETDPTMGHPGDWYLSLSWTDFKNQYGDETLWGELKRSDGWNATKSIETLQETFGMTPVLIYNVLDPATHQTDVVDENVTFAADALTQPVAEKYAFLDSFVIQDVADTITYEEGTDYSLEMIGGIVQITRLAAGTIGATDTVHVDYTYSDPTAITDTEISAAIAKVDDIILKYGFANLPGWLSAPEWSRRSSGLITYASTRGALLAAANSINEVFTSRFVYDLNEANVISSNDLQDLFDEKTVLSENGRAFAGAGSTSTGKTEQLLSDWYMGLMLNEVNQNGFPGVSPSNRVLSNFTPTKKYTFPTQSNAIRDKGIITVLLDPADRGWVSWGTWTSYFNGTQTDLSLDSTNQNDLINYLIKLLVRDVWVKNTDRNFNKILLSDFEDKWNSLGKLKVGQGKVLGWNVEFREEDNPNPAEFVKFRLSILAPEPAKRTDIEIQVDFSYFDTLFG